MQGQHRSLKEKLVRSKQDSDELREEMASLYRLKDRQRTLELQLKVTLTACLLALFVPSERHGTRAQGCTAGLRHPMCACTHGLLIYMCIYISNALSTMVSMMADHLAVELGVLGARILCWNLGPQNNRLRETGVGDFCMRCEGQLASS